MPWHQLDIQGRGDQFIVMGRHIFRAPQPIAHATGTETNNAKTEQAGEYFSASKRHG